MTWIPRGGALVPLGLAGGVVVCAVFPVTGQQRFVLLETALLAAFLLAGHATVGRPLGALVNERNLFSLSRLQLLLWTAVLLGGYGAMALGRLGSPDPLGVAVPKELWWLAGISAGSLAGSPLLLAGKAGLVPGPDAAATTADQLVAAGDADTTARTVNDSRVGTLFANPLASDARWRDLFEGDEVGNAARVDVAKLQMLFFTVLLVATYVAALWSALGAPPILDAAVQPIASLPAVPEGMVALLGLSHAGYLAQKAADHSATQQRPAAPK